MSKLKKKLWHGIQRHLQDKEWYSVLLACDTGRSRLIKKNKFDDAIALLKETALEVVGKNRPDEANALVMGIIKTLQQLCEVKKTHCTPEHTEHILAVLNKFPDHPEPTFIKEKVDDDSAIQSKIKTLLAACEFTKKYAPPGSQEGETSSSSSSSNPEGKTDTVVTESSFGKLQSEIPKRGSRALHAQLARLYTCANDHRNANIHYLLAGCFADEHAAQAVLWSHHGYPSEFDLFVGRVQLQYLQHGNVAGANAFREALKRKRGHVRFGNSKMTLRDVKVRLDSKPLFGGYQETEVKQKAPGMEKDPFTMAYLLGDNSLDTPFLHFCDFVTEAAEKSFEPDLFVMLRVKYRPTLLRDPGLNSIINAIGVLFFRQPKLRSGLAAVFSTK